MTPGRFAAVAVVAVVVAFGAAFAIGKATAGGSSKASAPSAVTPITVSDGPQLASFSSSGALPGPKQKSGGVSVGGGGGATPVPSTPAPSTPAPSSPASASPA